MPQGLRQTIERALAPGETALAVLESDLSRERRFSAGLLLLSDRRWLAWDGEQLVDDVDRSRVRGIDLAEHGSLLEVLVEFPDGVQSYPLTSGRRSDARRFVDRVGADLRGAASHADDRVCRRCG